MEAARNHWRGGESRVASLRAAHSEVPWQAAADIRHRLTHGYDTVDYEIIRSTVRDDLPALLPALVPLHQAVAAELAEDEKDES